MATQSLIVVGRSFTELSDHAQVMEEMHHEAQGGNDKKPRYQGNFSVTHSSSQFIGGSFIIDICHVLCIDPNVSQFDPFK